MPDIKQMAIGYAEHARGRFLLTLSKVPDDKLTWSPAPTAANALRMSYHVGGAAEWFVPILRGEKSPEFGPETIPDDLTRETVVKLVNESTDQVIAAINDLPEARLDEVLDLGFMKMPMASFIMMPGNHLDAHAAQIDYLQTCWGDKEFHY